MTGKILPSFTKLITRYMWFFFVVVVFVCFHWLKSCLPIFRIFGYESVFTVCYSLTVSAGVSVPILLCSHTHIHDVKPNKPHQSLTIHCKPFVSYWNGQLLGKKPWSFTLNNIGQPKREEGGLGALFSMLLWRAASYTFTALLQIQASPLNKHMPRLW